MRDIINFMVIEPNGEVKGGECNGVAFEVEVERQLFYVSWYYTLYYLKVESRNPSGFCSGRMSMSTAQVTLPTNDKDN